MDLSNIVASLKYGNIITKGRLVGLYVAIALNLVIPLITIFIAIMSILNNDLVIGMIMGIGSIVFVILVGLLISIPIRDKNVKKKITIWLNDALELTAYSKSIHKEFNFQFTMYHKIEVSFKVNGKKVTKKSGEGYHKIFSQYKDREIRILYSPKYDEVLILKDNK